MISISTSSFSRKAYKTLTLSCIAAAGLFLSSCLPDTASYREQVTDRLASPIQMIERDIKTEKFTLRAYERAYNTGGDAIIYIAGEGDGWAAHRTPAQNPTPRNPVAMYMAAKDGGQNVVYLARPCQYVPLSQAGACATPKYWVEGRYAPEVIDSMNEAIDNIKQRYNFKNINLVGHASGGGVAIILAAKRHDVTSIRTTSAILDHVKWSEKYNRVKFEGSLNPIDFAPAVARIPQHHFFPEWNRWDYEDMYKDYYNASSKSGCLRGSTVNDTDHDRGWGVVWSELLTEPLDCLNL